MSGKQACYGEIQGVHNCCDATASEEMKYQGHLAASPLPIPQHFHAASNHMSSSEPKKKKKVLLGKHWWMIKLQVTHIPDQSTWTRHTTNVRNVRRRKNALHKKAEGYDLQHPGTIYRKIHSPATSVCRWNERSNVERLSAASRLKRSYSLIWLLSFQVPGYRSQPPTIHAATMAV